MAKERANMTPEKQRTTIAEACGWHRVVGIGWSHPSLPAAANIYGRVPPDYLNDLNAMHEAEKVFNEDQRMEYWTTLDGLTGYRQQDYHAGMAGATLRAEAFLRTIGKWEEAP